MALNTIGIKLGYKTTGSTYADLPDLLEVPEMGGEPEKIDVTALADRVKKYIPGVKDLGDLSFKFLYDNSAATTSYRILKDLEEEKKAVDFELQYPDGTKHQFSAIPTTKMDSATVNDSLKFALMLSLQSEITIIDPV